MGHVLADHAGANVLLAVVLGRQFVFDVGQSQQTTQATTSAQSSPVPRSSALNSSRRLPSLNQNFGLLPSGSTDCESERSTRRMENSPMRSFYRLRTHEHHFHIRLGYLGAGLDWASALSHAISLI
ncbi:hypothetical protein J8C02_01415 [Chloracidobacterium sp. MS 40/45]|uniref:hypothetical protein n=1 Tax=Chloracidobacterium aggregatum TaxID=2851959 RepID=UPI001B8AC83B|nr:hypothetical protein [Chloracidobacterium aggregatum]QUW00205.1 hypothetical protein J8C02_01415 [Chloracidobacterium sp. MS 40/45]